MCNRFGLDELNDDERTRVSDFEHVSGFGILEVIRNDDGKIVPTLINGRHVDRSAWLEVVRIGNASCTGTVVGRNCVVTAAHCGRNNAKSTLEIYNGPKIDYRMVHMPQWRNKSNFDLAVLVLDQDVPSNVKPAKVGIDYQFSIGDDVDILGYGCTGLGGKGGNDGVLRFGESKVQSFTATDVVSHWREGNGGALCFGDSGGPMFANNSDTNPTRELIAVNSKGNIRDTNYNMRLDLPSVRDFLESVADRYDLEIFGLNATHDDDGPVVPDPSQPSDPKSVYRQLAKQYRKTSAHYEEQAREYDLLAASSNQGSTPSDPDHPPSDDGPMFGL